MTISEANSMPAMERLLGEGTHAAMEIPCRRLEKQPSDEREDRIADPAVFPWHGAGRDGSATCRQPTAHDQIISLLQHVDERPDV
jgi:hypothetical protein